MLDKLPQLFITNGITGAPRIAVRLIAIGELAPLILFCLAVRQ
jgi:hypothetical protein